MKRFGNLSIRAAWRCAWTARRRDPGSEGAWAEVPQRPNVSARRLGRGRRALRRREGERQPRQDEPLRTARLPGSHRRNPQRPVAARRGLFADFHFNPKHALTEQLLWDAEHAPENVGFSHNVQARTSRRGEEVVVEAILSVESVDLVADPATTRGLFESTGDARQTAPTLAEATVRASAATRADLVEAILSEPTAELAASGRSRAAPAGRGHGREEPAASAGLERGRVARSRFRRAPGRGRSSVAGSSSRSWPRRTRQAIRDLIEECAESRFARSRRLRLGRDDRATPPRVPRAEHEWRDGVVDVAAAHARRVGRARPNFVKLEPPAFRRRRTDVRQNALEIRGHEPRGRGGRPFDGHRDWRPGLPGDG